MTERATRAFVQERVGLIAQPLYEGVSAGLATAVARLSNFPHLEDYPALTPMIARYAMRNHWLGDDGVPSPWQVLGKPELMGQVILRNNDDDLELRLLKERRSTYPGGTPIAGKNLSRREYWTNQQLPLFPLPGGAQNITRLLLLWDQIIEDKHSVISVRVVHPVKPGRFGLAVPLDMSFEIQPGGGIFDQLAFKGSSQDVDFFANIAKDDNAHEQLG